MKTIWALVGCAVCISIFLSSCSTHPLTEPVLQKTESDSSLVPLNIQSDSVIVNPYGVAPLSAQIRFATSYDGTCTVTVVGQHGDASNIVHSFNDLGRSHVLMIIGLYAKRDNLVRVQVRTNTGVLRSDTTVHCVCGALPPNMPSSLNVLSRNDASVDDGLNLVSNYSAAGPQVPLMVDCFGDIRWCLDFRSHYALRNLVYDDGIARLRNGNFYFADISSNRIYEVDGLGMVVNAWDLFGYSFHHEVYEKPNGNFLVSVSKSGSAHLDGTGTVEDYIIEINRRSGAVVNEWDLKECLDENRQTFTTNRNDWVHVNAVCYDPSDNTIIVSGRTQGVVKLRYDNSIVWIMGCHRAWSTNRRGEDLNQYLLQPVDAQGNVINDPLVLDGTANHPDFEWNWCQHSTILVPNGDLMLFDNGDQRNFNSQPTANYSRAVEYRIDKTKRTVQQVWQYGKERGTECFSRIVSSVKYLPQNNHILFSPGYQVQTDNGFGGRVIEVDYATKQVVFELCVTAENKFGFHRVYRLPAYAQ